MLGCLVPPNRPRKLATDKKLNCRDSREPCSRLLLHQEE